MPLARLAACVSIRRPWAAPHLAQLQKRHIIDFRLRCGLVRDRKLEQVGTSEPQ